MKKHFFLMAIIAIFTFVPLQAQQKQKWDDQPYKYEVRVGCSPLLDLQGFPVNVGAGWSESALDLMYVDEAGSVYTAGGYFGEFGLCFRDWFSLGFQLSASGIWHDAYDNLSGERFRRSGALLSVMPVARLTWLRRRTLNMYSSFGMGASAAIYGGNAKADLAVCFIPVGMQFGGRVYGIAEWGFGRNASMQGIRVGVGMKF
jgi:hypothetical protein